jgi:hypothetical protein
MYMDEKQIADELLNEAWYLLRACTPADGDRERLEAWFRAVANRHAGTQYEHC